MTDAMPAEIVAFERRHDVRVASRDGFWLTGLVSTGPFTDAHRRISNLWEELIARQGELDLPGPPDEWLSLCHGRETEFSCYLGVATDERLAIVPAGMVAVEVPPHEYAVARVEGTQDDVHAVYTYLPAWIEEQGQKWNRTILWIEAYPEPYRDSQTELDFEVWLPLMNESGA
jgi:AraC family transcriptional regulator